MGGRRGHMPVRDCVDMRMDSVLYRRIAVADKDGEAVYEYSYCDSSDTDSGCGSRRGYTYGKKQKQLRKLRRMRQL